MRVVIDRGMQAGDQVVMDLEAGAYTRPPFSTT